jgi:hypothetical protein
MLLDEMTPAEQEALREVEDAERALERAEMRLFFVAGRARQRRHHLRSVPPEGEPCDSRR